jgi:hypothetical protein
VSQLLGGLFAGVPAVQVASAEARATAHLRRLNDARRRAALQDRLFSELLGVISHNLALAGQGVVLQLAAGAMREGSFTVGDFALFAIYLPRMGELVLSVSGLSARHARLPVSTDRLAALADGMPRDRLVEHAPIHAEGPPPAVPTIVKTPSDRLERVEVRDLSAGTIDGVSFVVRRGTLTVVAGRVGAGKTTLLRALLGLLPRPRGAIFWNGESIDDPGSLMVPPRVAHVPLEELQSILEPMLASPCVDGSGRVLLLLFTGNCGTRRGLRGAAPGRVAAARVSSAVDQPAGAADHRTGVAVELELSAKREAECARILRWCGAALDDRRSRGSAPHRRRP